MKSSYINSVFYTNENEVELFERLRLYYQCFDYRELPPFPNWNYEFDFWTDFKAFNDYPNKASIYMPFRIYICDKIVPIIFSSNNEQ